MNLDIPDFKNASVLVIGDLMLDQYWTGTTQRISPEAPVPVVQIDDITDRPGGAGNVALNVTALGAKCTLLAVVGNDKNGRSLCDYLENSGVQAKIHRVNGFDTITKLRVLSRNQQLIRLDIEDGIVPESDVLAEGLDDLIANHDVVVFSDYGKGTLTNIGKWIDQCREAGKKAIVDPKGGDFNRYRGASLITPNLKEFQEIVGECSDDREIHRSAVRLIRKAGLEGLLVTRGEAGMSFIPAEGEATHIPAQTREVFDVTGAGDTVIATLAAALAAGTDLEQGVLLSNLAAGVTVAKLGSATVSVPELKRASHAQRGRHGIVTENELLQLVAETRASGESIVMTNGCFDILHAGHVHYLNQAAGLGDHLIVAVNIDEAVRILKGEGRPVNSLESRMAVLAGLATVDWVVPFSEETPERLICEIRPDYLVKGGDNDPDRIPGARCVRETGGQVIVLDYIEGRSTTNIISQIREGDQ